MTDKEMMKAYMARNQVTKCKDSTRNSRTPKPKGAVHVQSRR